MENCIDANDTSNRSMTIRADVCAIFDVMSELRLKSYLITLDVCLEAVVFITCQENHFLLFISILNLL